MVIGINCGHTVSGQPGSGAVGYLDESIETREVGNRLAELLRSAGHTVINCTDDYSPSVSANLRKIMNMANAQPLDLFVSVHFNSGNGRGTEVFTYDGQSFREAKDVCAAISELGFINRGVKDGSALYVVRNSNAKAMLIEVCFVDTDDAEHYKKIGAQRVARAICEAIEGKSFEEEIDTEELKKLTERVAALEKQCAVYDYMDNNIPSWAKPTIQKLMDRKILVGSEEGKLGLTMGTIRMLVMLDRQGVFG